MRPCIFAFPSTVKHSLHRTTAMPAAAASSGISRVLYNTFFKKNSVFVTSIFASAVVFEVAFDNVTDKIWDDLNKGVSN